MGDSVSLCCCRVCGTAIEDPFYFPNDMSGCRIFFPLALRSSLATFLFLSRFFCHFSLRKCEIEENPNDIQGKKKQKTCNPFANPTWPSWLYIITGCQKRHIDRCWEERQSLLYPGGRDNHNSPAKKGKKWRAEQTRKSEKHYTLYYIRDIWKLLDMGFTSAASFYPSSSRSSGTWFVFYPTIAVS
jgi:hypothetical protein